MQSLDENGKPRYRAACDACRQSKVRCSGGGVCVRCKKHDYKCRYSIAHRAGKPKGSKNKATLKKLENLQAAQQGKLPLSCGAGVSSTRKVSRLFTGAEISQRNKRKTLSTDDIGARYDLVRPSQLHLRTASHTVARKYVFAGPNFTLYSSPISPAEPHLWEGGMPSADMGVYDPLESMHGHIDSTALASCLPSPSEEHSTMFGQETFSPAVARACDCVNRLYASLQQLSTLNSDLTLLRFDPTMEVITASLSSCHIFLSCAACPKISGGSMWLLISVLDRSFDVLNRLILHRGNQKGHEVWSGHPQQPPHVIPYNYAVVLQDCILEQSTATSYQIVRALKDAIGTEIGTSGGVLGDISSMHNHGLSSSLSTSSSSSGLPSPASVETPVQDVVVKSELPFHPELATFQTGSRTRSKNDLGSNQHDFLLQAICRYDIMIGNMQAIVARSAAAATAHAHPASWSIGMSDPATNQHVGGCVASYQPATTTSLDGFSQPPQHPEHAQVFASFDGIRLS